MTVLQRHADNLRAAFDRFAELEQPLADAAAAIATSLGAGGKVLAAGNGGSAAEAQHLTSEMIGRLHPDRERAALAAVALHADTSTMTAVGNDYGYEQVFARQVQGIGRPEDVLVLLSTSGSSRNLVLAAEAARTIGMTTVGLVGPVPRDLHRLCDHVLGMPSDCMQAVQVCHLVVVHSLVEQVEDLLIGRESMTN